MRTDWNIVAAILITVAIVNVCYTLSFQGSGGRLSDHVAVIVLKLPRSGSSWFTELLNNDAYTFVSKEIIQSADATVYNRFQKESHLATALYYPTGKLARSNSVLPSGRFLEDYWLHGSLKMFAYQKVVGFTVNPEHIDGISWKQVLKRVSSVKLVVYARSSIVKSAISAYTGNILKNRCGLANIKQGRSDCVPQRNITLDTKDLIDATITWQERYDNFYGYIRNDETLQRLPTLEVFYEDLQVDAPGTMQRLMQFLEHPSHGQAQALSPTAAATPTENRSSRRGAPSLQRSGWVKRSPDDLSQLYNNFEEVVRQLSPPECSALRNQLQDKRSTVFRRDTLQREDHSALQDLIRCNYILFS